MNATYDGIIPLEVQNNFLNSAYNDESMKQRLERSILYVAEVDGIVGGNVELAAIYVNPEYQGKAIGTALLQQAINELEGTKEIYINVEKENQIGMTFYKAKGFEIVKEFDDDLDGHNLRTIRMDKKI